MSVAKPNKLRFCKISDYDTVSRYLQKTIKEHLSRGQTVLWVITGGSSIATEVQTAKLLTRAPLKKLMVALTDERYGPPGHTDSNWQQLKKAGFSLKAAQLQPVLRGADFVTTAQHYSDNLEQAFRQADYSIGVFGIGADGHIAGIKPDSSAASADQLAIAYSWSDFRRITMSFKAITMLDEAVSCMLDKDRWPLLDKLQGDLPVTEMPAQILKKVPKCTIFNNHKGDQL